MDSKKVAICIIISIIIIIILSVILLMINGNNFTEKGVSNNIAINNNVVQKELLNVTDKAKFYTVSNCYYQYLSEININNSKYYRLDENGKNEKVINEEIIKQNIYDLLSEEYINKNDITVNNVYKYIDNISEQMIFTPMKMKVLKNKDIEKYIIYGIMQNANNTFSKEIYAIVNLDLNYRTFSIEPINTKYNSIEDIIIDNDIKSIKTNDNNTFNFINVNDEYIVKQYINAYKRIALSNPQIAYNYLDKEYKQVRFGDIENFRKYIEKNRDKINSTTLSKYLVTNNEKYKQYTCIMENEDYYIIREKGIMEYTIILDTYTIDLPEYIEKYNKSNEQQKTAYCINRFIQSINDENYKFAYSLLASSFKNNYFKTEQSFENYIKQNFIQKQKITFEQFTNEGNLYYTYKVILRNENSKQIEKTFIVKLGEGTNFELSFNVD